ncbi:hypothetical protein [Kitasatospora sp. NPDC058190]
MESTAPAVQPEEGSGLLVGVRAILARMALAEPIPDKRLRTVLDVLSAGC